MKKNQLLIAGLTIAQSIFVTIQKELFLWSQSILLNKKPNHRDLSSVKRFTNYNTLLVFSILLLGLTTYSQTYKNFTLRKQVDIRGKMVVAGNNILGHDTTLPFNDNTKSNQDISMKYIDIDSDPTTFNSSSADLLVPTQKDGTASNCNKVAYAALYWGAMLQTASRTDINKVKLKLPGASTYTDINGELIYDASVAPIVARINEPGNMPYACYADVTDLLISMSSLAGTYTVANVVSNEGTNYSTGLSAGWTLFVVYEDPTLSMKSFNVFDGFAQIYDTKVEEIPVSGFITPQSGSIDLQFAYASLDGDKTIGATKLEFGTKQVTTPLRPANEFFNATIENTNGVQTPRSPSGSNTLGYDTGMLEVAGAEPEYIKNGQTSTYFSLQVANGQKDPVYAFFSAYAVDIIAPKIDLSKIVKNTSGVDIGGGNVTLGEYLTYEISYQSIGNDNVTNFTIKDVLPENIVFDPTTQIDYSNAGGATLQSYDPATRTIIFSIPNSSVQINGALYTIRLNIQVVPDCNMLSNACSNIIKNQAFATYRGSINTDLIEQEGSYATTVCKLGIPESTNFIVDISNCKFTQTEILCGASVVLTAADGYDSYSWSSSPTGTPVIGTGQTYTATQTGTYYVHNTATPGCQSIDETITVIPYGNTISNPVIPFADEIVSCPNNGKALPNIFLCGANATKAITTGISDATSISWQKLDENSCTAITIEDCANESATCTWNEVGTGPNYTANTSGQFRIVINYPGGCYSIFYFNVYQNVLNPTATSRDIICTTLGQITVGGVPSGYEYSLDGSNFQPSNVFSISTAGLYTVYIRQIGVDTNPCIFTVPDILIRQRDFTVSTIVTQPLCNGDKGSIKIAANDIRPQYYFSIYQGTTSINSVGPISDSEYEFPNLNAGTYTIRVWSEDGCDYSEDITLINPPLITATSALTKPLTCEDGEITVYPQGGTPPYTYFINGTDDFQYSPQIIVSNPLPVGGLYSIIVEDIKGCRATTSITVAATPPPVFTVEQTNILCYGDASGAIYFNVSNSNGYTLTYSIDNGATYSDNPSFSNLTAGTYNTIVKYSLAGTDCFTTAQTITITQPAAAVTATASITELAGCGTAGEGKISITNPQGGIAPYEYSFDNQATWSTTNEAYKAPGTYTVYVRDANACVYSMTINIAPPPVAPTIAITDPTYNCDGTVNSTITITATPNADYTYQYLLDGVVNTNVPDNVFTNLTSGNHTISVKYISTTSAVSCIPQTDFAVVIPEGRPFTASISGVQNLSCSGANDGEITIVAANFDSTNGFQYSTDNGTTWTTQLTSPYTITGLAAGTYNIRIRYSATSAASCSQSFTQLITAPTQLIVSANVTTPAKCSVGATIEASATGGTPAYRYELWDATATTTIIPSQNSGLFTNVAPGTYIVRAYDANNCSDDTPVITVVSPPTLSASLDPNSDICYDSTNQATLSVLVSGGTAPFVYSLDGAPAQTSSTFTNVSVGNHTIIVTDSYGCTAPAISITIAPQLTATISNVKELDCTSSPNAVISGSISGGYPPYVVTLISGTGPGIIAQPAATTFTYTTAVASTYQFQIQDSKGCITTTSATINPLAAITATLNPVNPSCNGATDGSVQIIPSGGVGPYTYSIDGTNYVTTSLFTGLAAGDYTFYIKDAKECFITKTITLTQPTTLTTTATVIPFSCSTSNTKQAATITVEIPTTGTAPYLFSINGSAYSTTRTATIYDNGTTQTIPFSVKDANGCTYSDTVTLSALNPPVAGTISTTAITCLVTTSTVTVTPSSGTGVGPLTYEITSPASAITSNTTGEFTGLFPGTYVFKVTDANGCYYIQSHEVLAVTPIAISGNVTSDVLCKGGNTGSAVFTVSGFSGNYNYRIDSGATITGQTAATISLDNYPAGTYTISVTDENTSCTDSATITISEPANALALTATASNINCNNDNAQITVTATGGTLNYGYAAVVASASAPTTYSNSNIVTIDTNSGANLSWDVYVQDANGCTEMTNVTITSDPLPSVTTPPLASNQCTASTAYTFTASGTGGIAPLRYSINGGSTYQNSPTFTVNAPGSYYVTVIDANGCTDISDTPTIVYPKLALSAVLDKVLSCSTPMEAQITLTATNGNNASYTYAYSTDGTNFTDMGSNVFNTTTPGSYTFRVTDANGCTTTTSTAFVLTAPVSPEITTIDKTQDIYCNGESTASIKVNIDSTKGLAPFTYSIDGTNFQNSNVFSNLAAGDYTVTLRDSNGCTNTMDTTILQPDPLNFTLSKTDITCASTALGSLTINVDAITGLGGTAPYTYIMTNNIGEPTQTIANATGTNHTFTNLNFGTYYITIVDSNGCTLKMTAKVASPPDNLDIVVESTADCASGGTVSVTAIGPLLSSGPFYFAKYEKDPITGLYPSTPQFIAGVVQPPFQEEDAPGVLPHTSTFTGLLQGVIYSFIVYDQATGCSYIKEASAPTIKATSLATLRVVTDVTCKGADDGTVSITLDKDPLAAPGYIPPTSVDYSVYDSKTNMPLVPVNQELGIIVGAYPFTMPLIGGLAPGSYYVVITEHGGTNDGCMSATLPFDIYESVTELELTATVVKKANCNLNSGQIVAIAKGGTTVSREDPLAVPPQVATPVPYQYQILPDTGIIGDATDDTAPLADDTNWANTNTFYKDAGDYIVYAMDANKCIKAFPITLDSDAAPTINTPSPICFNGNPFTISITGTTDTNIAGNPTYSVNGSAFQSSPDFTFDNPGTYNLVIKDGNGCTTTVNYVVYPQLQIEAALTKDLDCSVSPDATITVTATGGNTAPSANYSYESSIDGTNWNSMASNVYTATADGTFYFRVTDNNNPTSCQVQTSLTIDPIAPTVFSTIETDVKCNGSNEGTITVNVTAGEGPYQYKLEGPVPYTFQPSNQFNNLIAGTTYIVTVKDRNNCEYTSAAITIEQPTALSATSTLTTALSCGTGNAAQEATVTITGINGTAPYTYSYNGGTTFTSSNIYQSFVGTTFDVIVKDANGCIFTLPNGVNIQPLNPPTDMTFDTTSKVTCLAPGTVEITSVTGGTLPLSYAIVFPASAISNNTGASSGIFTGLAPDTYLFQVTDANGCTYQEAYTVDPVTNITVSGLLVSDVNCNSESNGEVQFTVANFTGTYSYVFNGEPIVSGQNLTTITKNNLTAGTYPITITDETTGCEATASVTVSEPTPLDLTETTNINANCNFGAQVSVTATGGIPPYSYSFVPSGSGAVTYTNSASTVLDPNVSTSWDVWVQDSNGCIISSPLLVSIATDPLPTVTVEPYSQCPSGTGEYTFTLTPTGVGPFEYNIGSGYQSSPTFTVNIPGTYDVTVRDKNGCTTTVNGLVSILPALQLEATITTLPSCADGDGTLTLTATGGSGNYEYSLDGTAQSVADFTNITAGSHTATVRDVTTNCTFSIQVSLEAATPVTGFALSKTDISCYGGSDGVITATMDTPAPGINDNPIYMYSLSGAATRAPQQSNIFSGLAPGNYTVMVTSARGCTATATIDIIEPAIITVPAPDVEQFGCTAGTNTTNLATITVNGVTGGSGTYNYEFIKNGNTVQFGINNTYTEADLLGGNYTVNVYDDKGCMGTAPATITIVPFIALDKITVTVDNPITCTNLEDITVSVSSIGGTSTNLQYTVVDLSGAQVITPNTTGIFTGLNIGTYQITVENLDTGCSVQTIHYVNEPNTFVVNTSNVVDVSCYGGSNGSVAVTIVDTVINTNDPDQSGAFNYTIVDALNNPVTSGVSATAGPITINNLAAGIYTITATLTNSPYCSATTNFTITQPSAELKISETHTEITCVSGNNDGSITATATGGWGGYEFELVGPITVAYSSQSTFTNLTAGTYAVNVRDSKGCIASANVTLVIPTPISITASSDTVMLSCFGDKTATINVTSTSGGQGANYLYTLNTTSLVPPTSSGPQASPIFSGLGAGTYTVTVTDGYNCSATSTSMVISEPTQINSNLVVANTQSCDNLTTLTLSATGGTGIYTYSDNAAFTTTLGSFTTAVNIQVPPGTYAYYVKDANGCISVKSNDIEITPLVPLTIAIDKTNAVINCAGDNTGVIVATAEGGLGNYSYTLLDGAGATLQGPVASGNFTGLFAGDYRVTVDSGDCNNTSAVITITQPLLPLTATYVITPVSCNGANNGIFTVNATGGTGIIKYAISPNMNQFFDSNIFDNLAPGNYDVVVQDALGCFVLINFDMTEPTPIRATLDASSIVPEVCYGDNDAAFSIDISGGVMPYSVNLDNPTGTYTTGTATQTRFDFTGITGGTHIVYIIDANGCSFELEVPLEESVNIDPVALVDYGCVNNAAANSVTVTVDPSITNPSDLDYSLDGTNYQTSNTFTNLAPGVGYQIYVRHTNGCIKTTPAFNILQVDPLTLILTDGGLNEIVANAAGGGGGYQYTFNGEDNGTKNTYIIYKSGDYTVQVTDVNGCTAIATRYFEYIDVCIPNYFTPNGDGVNDGWAPGCTENYKDLTFDIFDRYGRKIATYHVGEKWDGKYHGNELPSGDYWYVLKLNDKKDNREFVGHFTLYR